MSAQQELTVEEIRDDLRISSAMVYKLINNDPDFVTYKVGGSRRMSRVDLEAWKAKQKQKEQVPA